MKKYRTWLAYAIVFGLIIFANVPAQAQPTDKNRLSILPTENYTFFSKFGSYGSDYGYFNQPNGVAIDSSDNVYVLDLDNSRVQKFDCMGNFIAKWGSPGTEDGKFRMIRGIATDSSDNVYITDWYTHRVQKFSNGGQFLKAWGLYGTGDGQFNQPLGIAIDSSDNVYVTDAGNHRIQKFDSDGNFITKWNCNGELKYPHDVAVDVSNNVYVVDPVTLYAYKFDNVGNLITKWNTRNTSDEAQKSCPYHVAVDPSGNVFVANYMHLVDYTYACIQKFDSNGNFITKWGSYGSGDGQFCRVQGMAVNSTGYVYISDDEINHRIEVFVKGNEIISPVAAFSASPTSGKAPLTVSFTDMSTGAPTSWKWTFGDGAKSSVQNPKYKYSQEGKYKVTLTVTNAEGSNTTTKNKYIIVTTNTRPGRYLRK